MSNKTSFWLDQSSIYLDEQRKTKIILTAIIIAIISGFFLLFLLTPSSSAKDNKTNSNELIDLTNQERILQHLPALSKNAKLTQAAQEKLKDLFKEQYFSHNAPDGKTFSSWVKDVDYAYTIVGENLAMGFGDAQQIIDAWMQSPKHRENILKNQYTEIGLAVASGKFNGKNTTMVVQYFGATNIKKLSELLIPYQRISKDISDFLIKV